ncbi:AP2-like ethylene-responsive transcription factor AIL7 [Oryza brachyantha]|nr:AP2-like ethylene-responsive transcription factor AIL7 [Oryza brachyantha]
MLPPTNGAVSLAFLHMGGPLSDALLFPFDGLSCDDFALPASIAAPQPLLPDPAPLLFLPPSSGNSEHASSGMGAVAARTSASTEVTPIISWGSGGGGGGSSARAVRSPSPALPLVQGTGQRTSCYRGVTRHRWTGRYEAHLWDNTCRREGQKRKGRQVYLGGYDIEDKAARAYDLAALKYWGASATTNFPKQSYIKEIEEMQNMSKQELVASLRRKSSGFSRGASIYRGVTRHHQHGRWQARIGRVAGNKDLYLGTFATEEEAAEAYDIAALKFRGVNAVTNFEPSRYNLEAISQSDLPISISGRRQNSSNKPAPEAEGHITLSSPPISQQSSNSGSAAPCLLHNLLQFQPCGPPQALPLPGYSYAEPGFCWPFGDGEQKVQLNSKVEMANGFLLHLGNAAN